MSGFLATLLDRYHEQMLRHRNRTFLRAAMGACALVASGNGAVTLGERVRLDRLLETLDALKVFDPHEGVTLFDEFVDGLRASEEEGLRDIHAAIDEEVAEEPEKAALLVRLCLAVSETADGIPAPELARIQALCEHLGLDAQQCSGQVPET